PTSPSTVEQEVSEFLNPDLRHHRNPTSVENHDSPYWVLVEELYHLFLDAAHGKASPSPEAVSRVEARVASDTASLSTQLLMEELESLSARLSEVQSWVWPLQHDVDRLVESRSWKITAPLRKAHAFFVREDKTDEP
ncbi:MAG: hypothetical protein RDU20_23145, partial [Desulfomonilaceae bacterium]|nr:hypothetical protein [Desulfomonilaceae bacterium]